MNARSSKPRRVLAIAPSYRGFGFAFFDGVTLADWGIKAVSGDRHEGCLVTVKRLVARFEPHVIALENHESQEFRRAQRIRLLQEAIIELAVRQGVRTAMFSREQVAKVFCKSAKGSKFSMVEALAVRFPDELSIHMPPKRQPWMAEDPRMRLFDAVALAAMVGDPS